MTQSPVRGSPYRHKFHVVGFLSKWANTASIWLERRRQRRALATLDDHLLRDVGLQREQARDEAAKPFWKR